LAHTAAPVSLAARPGRERSPDAARRRGRQGFGSRGHGRQCRRPPHRLAAGAHCRAVTLRAAG
ncbi:hypothetical protein BN1708_020091, partial [Verticillium longisporum]